jgi:hypothetical protein
MAARNGGVARWPKLDRLGEIFEEFASHEDHHQVLTTSSGMPETRRALNGEYGRKHACSIGD